MKTVGVILCIFQVAVTAQRGPAQAGTDPCNSHITIDEPARHVSTVRVSNSNDAGICDRDLELGWYRFKVGGNDAVIPTTCIRNDLGGTQLPMHFDLGNRSEPGDHQTVEGHVCTSFNILGQWDCCVLRQVASVRNCTDYLVYYLPPTDRCPVAYVVHETNVGPTHDQMVRTGDNTNNRLERSTVGGQEAVTSTNCSAPSVLCQDNSGCGIRCNIFPECEDGSDETDCALPCMEGMSRCEGMTEGQSVCASQCNGVQDCLDDSDEENCGTSKPNPQNSTTAQATEASSYTGLTSSSATQSFSTIGQSDAAVSTSSIASIGSQETSMPTQSTPTTGIESTQSTESLPSVSSQETSTDQSSTTGASQSTPSTDTTQSGLSSQSTPSTDTTQSGLSSPSTPSTDTTQSGLSSPSTPSTDTTQSGLPSQSTPSTESSQSGLSSQSTSGTGISQSGLSSGSTPSTDASQSELSSQSTSSTGISQSELSNQSTPTSTNTSVTTAQTTTEPSVTSGQTTTLPTTQTPIVQSTTSTQTTRLSSIRSTTTQPTTQTTRLSTTSTQPTTQTTRLSTTTTQPTTQTTDMPTTTTQPTTQTTDMPATTTQPTTQTTDMPTTTTQPTTQTTDIPTTTTQPTTPTTHLPTTTTQPTTQTTHLPTTTSTTTQPTTPTTHLPTTTTQPTTQTTDIPTTTSTTTQPTTPTTHLPTTTSQPTTQTTHLPTTTSTTTSPTTRIQTTTSPSTALPISHPRTTTQSSSTLTTTTTTSTTTTTIPTAVTHISQETTSRPPRPSTTETTSPTTDETTSSRSSQGVPDQYDHTTLVSTQPIEPLSDSTSVTMTTAEVVKTTEGRDTVTVLGMHLGLFIFLVVSAMCCLTILIFGIVGLICRRKYYTWTPEMAHQDAYASVEKANLSFQLDKDNVGVHSPITDLEILQGEEMIEKETSLTNASTLTCPPTPSMGSGLKGQQSFSINTETEAVQPPVNGLGSGEVNPAFTYDTSAGQDGVVPISEMMNDVDEVSPRNDFPWIEDTKL